jgi:hypothetical protein
VFVGLAVIAGCFALSFDQFPVLVRNFDARDIGAMSVDKGDYFRTKIVTEILPAGDLVFGWLAAFGGFSDPGHSLELFEGIHCL